MNSIPEWATHVAVDFDGSVWAFEGRPYMDDTGCWMPADSGDGLRYQDIRDHGFVPESVARLLCVRIPREDDEQRNAEAMAYHHERDTLLAELAAMPTYIEAKSLAATTAATDALIRRARDLFRKPPMAEPA